MADLGINPVHILLVASMIFAVLLVEVGYMLFAASDSGKKRINRRIRASNDDGKLNKRDILIKLRKERGLDSEGKMVLPLKWLNRRIVQAGITIGLGKLLMFYIAYLFASSLAFLFVTESLGNTLAALPFTGILIPLFILNFRRNRKMNRFGTQLPEAIDLITRSLKAGHPVPVAISMVAREMPDPIGTEFGMVTDEVTYGSDLVTALNGLYERVGHDDLPLLVSSVSIQASTGGNLREILEGLAQVIRDRMKMKRKVKAISAEGRMSAIFLSAMPVLLFLALMFITPDYYAGIWNEDLTFLLMGGLGVWLVLGNLMIFKLVKFKI